MRRLVILAGAVIILAAANLNIYQREQLLASGRSVLLELAPVDPRSLMQGDYMALRFAVENAFASIPREDLRDGRMVLTLDERTVGRFARFDTGVPLAPNEVVMRYRARNQRPKFGTNAFFFQEGHADLYAGARYGEFKVAASGDAILVALRRENLEVLGPPLLGHMAIRKGPWKLVKTMEGPILNADTSDPDLSGAQLFNLVDDIGEKNDLAATRPEKVKELAGDWLRWSKDMARPLWGPGAGGRGRGGAELP